MAGLCEAERTPGAAPGARQVNQLIPASGSRRHSIDKQRVENLKRLGDTGTEVADKVLKYEQPCSTCSGTGIYPSKKNLRRTEPVECGVCNGTGHMIVPPAPFAKLAGEMAKMGQRLQGPDAAQDEERRVTKVTMVWEFPERQAIDVTPERAEIEAGE